MYIIITVTLVALKVINDSIKYKKIRYEYILTKKGFIFLV